MRGRRDCGSKRKEGSSEWIEGKGGAERTYRDVRADAQLEAGDDLPEAADRDRAVLGRAVLTL